MRARRGKLGGGRASAIAGALALLCACGESGDGEASGNAAGPGSVGPSSSENVLVIVLDALHAGHLGHLGYERDTSPSIDALSRRGVSFARAFAPAPYTLASIPSLLTGRLPDRHGLVQKSFRLADSERTLAEHLGALGFETRAAVGNMNGSELYGLDQGFDEFHNLMRAGDTRVVRDADGVLVLPADPELRVPRAADFVELFEGWLEAGAGAERPTLFYLHILEPHSPYDPPAEYRDRWLDPDYDGPFAGGDNETLIGSNFGRVPVSEPDVEAVRALYDANLAYADAQVGRLLEALEAHGLRDTTHVILTSDHGEAFWQHGRWGHNDDLYDEALRVPIVIDPAGTDHPAGATPPELASTLDLLPTISGLLDEPPPEVLLDGVDLLGGAPDADRLLAFRSHALLPDLGWRSQSTKAIALRPPEPLEGSPEFERLELYDLDRDPLEQRDRAPAATAEQLNQTWSRFRTLRDTLALEPAAPAAGPELDAAQQAMLEQLGYIDKD